MKKRVLIGAVLALVIAAIVAPAAAQAKRATAFRNIKYSYSLPKTSPEQGVAITGRLVSRKPVTRHGRHVKVDAVQNGTVALQSMNETGWATVDSTTTVKGHFTLRAYDAGHYRVRFKATSSRGGSTQWLSVTDHAISLDNLHAVSVSLEASGDVFVVVAADLNAPASAITSDTPTIVMFAFSNVGTELTDFISDSPFAGIHMTTAINPGVVRFGFSIPVDSVDTTIQVAGQTLNTGLHASASASTEFVPRDLMP